jgi:hypothetical protein
MTLIAGNPGTGKSQIAADAAARISTGKNWPNGARAPIGDVVVLATEDAIDDTWVPRLMAAGADLSRLHFLKMAIGDDGKRRTFNLQNDLVALAEKILSLLRSQLVIIDPITSYLGEADSHRTSEVRAILEPIGGFAARCGVAVLAITHPPKAQGSAMNAFTGSRCPNFPKVPKHKRTEAIRFLKKKKPRTTPRPGLLFLGESFPQWLRGRPPQMREWRQKLKLTQRESPDRAIRAFDAECCNGASRRGE